MDSFAAYQHISIVAAATAEPRALGIVLITGLALLALALMVLMLTRWGQAEPLSKCVVLSVFAHVLLLIYAYSADLWAETPPPPEEVVRVTINSDDGDERRQQQPLPPTPDIWNEFTAEALPPEIETPVREVIDPLTDYEREAPELQMPPEPLAMPDNLSVVEPQRSPLDEVVQTPPVAGVTAPRAAVAPTQIEVPKAERVEQPETFQPPAPEVERMEPSIAEILPQRTRVENVTELPVDQAENLQTTRDAQLAAPVADAIADATDRLDSATNTRSDLVQLPDFAPGASSIVPLPVPSPASTPPIARQPRAPVEIAVRPGDGSQLPSVYQSRVAQDRVQLIEQFGGNARTEAAVEAALVWLAAQQNRDGRWDAGAFGAGRETNTLGHSRGGAGADADTGITGLALLAFLAAGHSHFEGDYRETVARGLEYLVRVQRTDGSMYGDAQLFARMYCHGIATLAISESYALTGDNRLMPFVQRAIGYTIRAQNSVDGGWRYMPGDRGDTSQLGWQLMALKSAELAGLPMPAATRSGMIAFLNSVASGRNRGLAAYRPGAAVTPTMTAEALACRFFLNVAADRPAIDEAANYLMQNLPDHRETNLYYWYYATLALFQLQDERWKLWNEHMQRELLAKQKTAGVLAGSWDPNTTWGGYGGRIYSTAMATLCLEVYYRYLPLFDAR